MKKIILILQCLSLTAILLLISSCAPHSSTGKMPAAPALTATARSTSNIQHIALLLPLTGSYAPYAAAIRDGFLTAYTDQKNHGGSAPAISIYDTNGKNIQMLVQAATAQGADFIVGPLNKAEVTSLAEDHTSSVPILALNTTPSTVRVKNNALYQFGLSPDDEAQQAAQRAWQDHHHNVLILAPNNPSGQRAVNAFSAQWKAYGGNIVATQYYGNMASLSKDISGVLRIDSAYQNERKLKSLFHENMRFIPVRRHDFDSIFLVATPAMGRQIQPLLRFYFVENTPIYSSSLIYSGTPDAGRDTDLNGIFFCDMPWIVAPTQMQPADLQYLKQKIQIQFPATAMHFSKFYAMGIDAFHLVSHLNNMKSNSQYAVPAATGTLFLTSQHVIYRQLTWSQFQNGQPQLVR
ncbi:MAG: penicillin-binding protein activator [Gammaproteobacteria bacterium]|nr:penicillin-binding protein activator [Gammaproteobacteria bacterium]